jgi:TonB family protein
VELEMNNNNRRLLALALFALSLLTGCTTEVSQHDSQPPLPSVDEVTNRRLARAAAAGESTPTLDQLTGLQWRRYVSCALASNLFVETKSVPDNPEAIVSIRLDAGGSVSSVALLGPSGNLAWDAAIQRAVAAASPLPPVRATHDFSRVDVHFRPYQPQAPGIGGSTGLTGESHWSVRHCTTAGGATACD